MISKGKKGKALSKPQENQEQKPADSVMLQVGVVGAGALGEGQWEKWDWL